jgi:hypothetical protein
VGSFQEYHFAARGITIDLTCAAFAYRAVQYRQDDRQCYTIGDA